MIWLVLACGEAPSGSTAAPAPPPEAAPIAAPAPAPPAPRGPAFPPRHRAGTIIGAAPNGVDPSLTTYAFPSAPPGPWPDAPGRCAAGMVKVAGRSGPFCIQAYEATFSGRVGKQDQGPDHPDGSTVGTVVADPTLAPTVGLSWYQAYAACKGAGLHLCTSLEWHDACAGPNARAWPTPDGTARSGRCGVGAGTSAAAFPPLPGGSFPDCHTPDGVYNLLGNAWEWVDPGYTTEEGLPLTDKRGAARYTFDLPTCTFNAAGTHAPTFSGTISFRCCAPLTP